MLIFRRPDKPTPIYTLDDFADGDYICQPKQDGWRAVIEFYKDEIVIWSRHHKPLPVSDEMIDVLKDIDVPHNTALDGEWLKRRPDYTGPELIYLFGVLYWDDKWVGGKPEIERINLLNTIENVDHPVLISPYTTSNYEEFFQNTKNDKRTEGVVLKDINGTLIGDREKSKNNPFWFKRKWRSGNDGRSLVA